MKQLVFKLILALIFVMLTGGMLACSEQVGGSQAWIDSPLDGSTVSAGAPVPVVSHAYAREGIAEVLLTVNGQAYRRNPPAQPGETLSKTTQEWFPPNEGDYVLQIKAYTKTGAATNPATVQVHVVGKTVPTPTQTRTPDRVAPVPVGAPDLTIVSVEAILAGMKGDTPICNTRVIYRNAGTAAVPSNFTIQFHFNGTPQLANIVAGGLGPGANAEIIFVYQFEGTPYIGITLDSTNVIAESSETNNAFAEARMCRSSAVPGISVTPTISPTPTRTPTIGIQPPATGCAGTPNISSFNASPATIQQGQSTTLSWGAVTNADAVSIDPGIGGVAAPGSRSVSPNSATTYTLSARCGNNVVTRQTTINVVSAPPPNTPTFTPTPTRTRTPTRDTQGPAAPNLIWPKETLQCRTSVTLDWNAVSDPSGIKEYIVKWNRNDGQSGGTVTSSTQHTISVSCGKSYTWSVKAVDNAGNEGGTSSATFTIQQGLY